jgi:RNA polymerase sigma-70 factor, ECF subfamily
MTRSTVDGHSSFVMAAPAAQLRSEAHPRAEVVAESSAPNLDVELRDTYVAYAPLVWRTLRRLGVADAQLDDGVQDVFLMVHRRRGKFEGRSSLKTWIVGIALRVAKDYRRAEVRRVRRIDRLAAWITCDTEATASPSDATEQREANDLLHCLLATLPDDLREMLVLVELEELPVREASEAIGIRLRTGQRRLRAAVEAMSAALAEYLEENRRSYP